ncbi:MAG: hypothetical protein ACOYEW_00705 [Anaerolineae bacterium]|jgi:hypothetical protein
MAKQTKWKKGRGKLGVFAPLMGRWVAEADSPQGPVRCVRSFRRVLGDTYIELSAVWSFADSTYEELALFGRDKEGRVRFWSFTSDGKQSTGELADVSDVHPEAVGFEAQMDAGLARQMYWPDDEGGFFWAVEAHGKAGWNRFVEHHYRPLTDPTSY